MRALLETDVILDLLLDRAPVPRPPASAGDSWANH